MRKLLAEDASQEIFHTCATARSPGAAQQHINHATKWLW